MLPRRAKTFLAAMAISTAGYACITSRRHKYGRQVGAGPRGRRMSGARCRRPRAAGAFKAQMQRSRLASPARKMASSERSARPEEMMMLAATRLLKDDDTLAMSLGARCRRSFAAHGFEAYEAA